MRSKVHWFVLGALLLMFTTGAQGSPQTPLSWQHVVDQHPNRVFVGQRKHLGWVRDQNRNFIDDLIERQFHPGDFVDVIVELNHCLSTEDISTRFGRFGRIAYTSKVLSAVYLNHVDFNQLHLLAESSDVAMVEWQAPNNPEVDIASRTVRAHKSVTYAGTSAEDMGIDGSGVTIAFIGTGISDATNSTNGFAQLSGKLVAGFDAGDPNDPGNGTTDPPDVTTHESVMAVMAVGAGAGTTCRTPDDGSVGANCAGIASGAKYVNVRQCIPNGNPLCPGYTYPIAVDWVAANATKFGIRVVNMSFTSCGDDDGTSAQSEQANYLVGLGMVVAAALKKNSEPGCNVAVGTQEIESPGAASFAIAVNGSDDQGTISTTGTTASAAQDSLWSNYVIGPRSDYATSQQVLALKPDVAAPAMNLSVLRSGTNVITGVAGTSPATAIVSGVAALIIQKYPAITPDSLKQLLAVTADPAGATMAFFTINNRTWDKGLGWGTVNAGAALQAATNQSTDLTFPSCKTGGTPGTPCLLTTGNQPWLNYDIQTTPNPPQANVQTTITITVVNQGTNPASNILVNFGIYDFTAAAPIFHHIGTYVIPQLAAGQSTQATQTWTPTVSGHQCVQVSIAYGLDSDYTNNMTQRNIMVGPSIFHAKVENTFFVPTKFEVDLHSNRLGWRCTVNQTTFQLEPRSCPLDLQIKFDAPPNTPPGVHGQCNVAVYATPQGSKRRLVGGVTVETYVPKPCRMYGQVFDKHGNAVSGARVSLTEVGHDEEQSKTRAGKMGGSTPSISVVTNTDGVFAATITPDIVHRLRIEKDKVGRGELMLRPGCGLSLDGIVLSSHGIEIKPIPPRTVESAALQSK